MNDLKVGGQLLIRLLLFRPSYIFSRGVDVMASIMLWIDLMIIIGCIL